MLMHVGSQGSDIGLFVWRWLRRICLAIFLLTMGACGTFPSEKLELEPAKGGVCNPLSVLKNSKLYQYKDLKTGAVTEPYAKLFERGEEWGCLVSMWDNRQASTEGGKLYASPVRLTKDGKLTSLEPVDGKEVPILRVPKNDKLTNFRFLLYVMKSSVVIPTQGKDLGKIQGATDSERQSLTADERKIRIALDTLKEMCRVADSPQYSCFGKNKGDCQFFFTLYPSAPNLPDVASALAKDSKKRSCVLCVPEVCNNQDDDCDGKIDNLRDPVTGDPVLDAQGKDKPLSQPCYDGKGEDLTNVEKSKGICKAGVKVCVGGVWSKCQNQTLPAKETCNGLDDDCDGRNDDTDGGPLCPPGQACENGSCGRTDCPPGRSECVVNGKEACYDLSNTQAHCGSCNTACKNGQVCVGGKCGLICPSGLTKCGNKCVDLNKDPLNCSACGNPCKTSEVCAGAKCGLVCPSGLTKCGNKCLDLASDPLNCGACSKPCNSGYVCVNSSCSLICPTGQTKCGNQCVNIQEDARNCSACGKLCKPGEICSKGACSLVCSGTLTKCGANCVDTSTNSSHCSKCNNLCKPGEVCVKGQCGIVCPSGQSKCGAQCVDFKTNNLNCGKCGVACKNGERCVNGACSIVCPGGQVKCGGQCCSTGQICCQGNVCADPKTSQANCGCSTSSAGSNCTSLNQLCKNGKCATVCPPNQAECGGQCCALGQVCCQGNVCADPKTNSKYCGCSASSSGTDCGAKNEACSNGTCSKVCSGGDVKCGASCCPASKVCCKGNVCVDPKTDGKFCGCNTGSSGSDCGGKTCSNGTCAPCFSGLTLCGTTCFNLQTDANHCGACNNKCPSGLCSAGKCVCPSGQTLCGASCFNLQADANNCGACNNKCPSGTCSAGKCVCPSGQTLCGSSCVNLQTDTKNCGACGKVCSGSSPCTAGACEELFAGSKLLNSAQMTKINTWVGVANQKWKLCFRISDDGKKSSDLHKQCEGKGPFVAVALLTDNKLIGGYGSVSLESKGRDYYGDNKSFLFSLTLDFKYVHFANSSFLYRDGNKLGPAWGGGLDWLSGGSDLTKGMYCKIGYSYKCKDQTQIAKCRTDFCGTGSNGMSELEVYIKK